MALSTSPWSEDEYLLSSFFRDISREAKSIGGFLNVKVPEPVFYLGKQYFYPLASWALKILKQLKQHG